MPEPEKPESEKPEKAKSEKDKAEKLEKEKTPAAAEPQPPVAAKPAAAQPEEDSSQSFFGEPLVGFDPNEISGSLIVIEGMDGSGRSTQISLLQEWLEAGRFSLQASRLVRFTRV